MKFEHVDILAAHRLPQGRYGGAFRGLGAVALGASVVERVLGALEAPPPERAFWGMARSHTQGMNPARTLALRAGLPPTSTATTLNMACGSGLQAILQAAQAIELGAGGRVLAGGSEAMSDTPHLVPGLRWGFRMGHRTLPDVMHQDGLRCPITGLLMGETIEDLAARRGITRAAADAYAARSHARAHAADFASELAPHPALGADEGIRPGVTPQSLATLAPVFHPGGQVTAGNASSLSDGAAALVLARAGLGAAPLARVLGCAEAGVDPMDMGEAPVPAIRKLLTQHGLRVQDVDLWEINEAFAAQILVCAEQLDLPEDRLNVVGGGIALGHPIGASGARIVTTLVHQLRARGGGLGVASLGIGGGLGLALLVEVPG